MWDGWRRMDAARWCTWAAFSAALVGAAVALVAPAGGVNRVQVSALAFAVGAVGLLADALLWNRGRWLAIGLYAVAALACMYAMIGALSLPLRLTVEGVCPPTSASCPLGFDRPATSGENAAVYAAAICGALALLLIFVAVEARYLRRSQVPIGRPQP